MKVIDAEVLLLAVILLASVSWADDSNCQNIQIGNSPIFEVLNQSELGMADKAKSLANACAELDPKGDLAQMPQGESVSREFVELTSQIAFAVSGLGAGAFSNFDHTMPQKEFKAKLALIKQIPSPIVRIERVYDLVNAMQGQYDDNMGILHMAKMGAKDGFFFTMRPENVMNAGVNNGSAGVCRDFAALLYWSLLQVARGPGPHSSELSLNDFSPEFESELLPSGAGDGTLGGHAWVRINLPARDSKGNLLFQQFDLDTTYYPGRFTPLSPRLIGMSSAEQSKAYQACSSAFYCLIGTKSSDSLLHAPSVPAKDCSGLGAKAAAACLDQNFPEPPAQLPTTN